MFVLLFFNVITKIYCITTIGDRTLPDRYTPPHKQYTQNELELLNRLLEDVQHRLQGSQDIVKHFMKLQQSVPYLQAHSLPATTNYAYDTTIEKPRLVALDVREGTKTTTPKRSLQPGDVIFGHLTFAPSRGFVESLKKEIRKPRIKLGLLMRAFIRLCEQIVVKQPGDVREVVQHTENTIKRMQSSGRLQWMDEPMTKILRQLSTQISVMPINELKNYVLLIKQMLENRKLILTPEINNLIDLANSVVRNWEFYVMMNAVRDFKNFPGSLKKNKNQRDTRIDDFCEKNKKSKMNKTLKALCDKRKKGKKPKYMPLPYTGPEMNKAILEAFQTPFASKKSSDLKKLVQLANEAFNKRFWHLLRTASNKGPSSYSIKQRLPAQVQIMFDYNIFRKVNSKQYTTKRMNSLYNYEDYILSSTECDSKNIEERDLITERRYFENRTQLEEKHKKENKNDARDNEHKVSKEDLSQITIKNSSEFLRTTKLENLFEYKSKFGYFPTMKTRYSIIKPNSGDKSKCKLNYNNTKVGFGNNVTYYRTHKNQKYLDDVQTKFRFTTKKMTEIYDRTIDEESYLKVNVKSLLIHSNNTINQTELLNTENPFLDSNLYVNTNHFKNISGLRAFPEVYQRGSVEDSFLKNNLYLSYNLSQMTDITPFPKHYHRVLEKLKQNPKGLHYLRKLRNLH